MGEGGGAATFASGAPVGVDEFGDSEKYQIVSATNARTNAVDPATRKTRQARDSADSDFISSPGAIVEIYQPRFEMN